MYKTKHIHTTTHKLKHEMKDPRSTHIQKNTNTNDTYKVREQHKPPTHTPTHTKTLTQARTHTHTQRHTCTTKTHENTHTHNHLNKHTHTQQEWKQRRSTKDNTYSKTVPYTQQQHGKHAQTHTLNRVKKIKCYMWGVAHTH